MLKALVIKINQQQALSTLIHEMLEALLKDLKNELKLAYSANVLKNFVSTLLLNIMGVGQLFKDGHSASLYTFCISYCCI